MSTNINDNGLYNINDLEHLANELFKTLPNEFPKEISLNPSKEEHPRAAKAAEILLHAANGTNNSPFAAQGPVMSIQHKTLLVVLADLHRLYNMKILELYL